MHFSFSKFFQCFLPYFRLYSACVSFSMFFSFLAIINVHQCVFFFTFSRVSCHISCPSVCFSFSMIFSILATLHVLQCAFLSFHVFHFSRHNPDPTVCISHFPRFSVFLNIFQVLPYLCHIFLVFFSFLVIIQVLQCAFLFFHKFHCYSPYFKSYVVCFSLYMIFSFLTILQVLHCAFLIFHAFQCFST